MPHPSGIELPSVNPLKQGLNRDINQIERMETDLTLKVKSALAAHNVNDNVHGVFSLDDLENKMASDLCGAIAVGVGYLRIEPTGDPKALLNTAPGGQATKLLDYIFGIILAVPTGSQCGERHTATQVLTALRFGIMGSIVDGDVSARTWDFVREAPDAQESTDTMLYYHQVWRLALPNVGNR